MSAIPERLAVSLASSGLSITLTSLTDIIAFCIGASSSFLSVRAFCLYTGKAASAFFVAEIFMSIAVNPFLSVRAICGWKRFLLERHQPAQE